MSQAHADAIRLRRARLVQAVVALYDNSAAGEPTPASTSSSSSSSAGFGPEDSDEYFSQQITFKDPLSSVAGLSDYKALFALLHATFPRISMRVQSVSWGRSSLVAQQPHPKDSAALAQSLSTVPSPSNPLECDMVLIDAHVTYQVNRFIRIPIRQVISLRIQQEEGGEKIVQHEDIHSFGDLISSIPLVGRLYDFSRWSLGRLMSWGTLCYYGLRSGSGLRGAIFHTGTLHTAWHPLESAKVGQQHQISSSQESATGGKKESEKEEMGQEERKGGRKNGSPSPTSHLSNRGKKHSASNSTLAQKQDL